MINKAIVKTELQLLRSDQGNVVLGMVVGLVIGLGIALAAAYYIQKNPPQERGNLRPPEVSMVSKVSPDGSPANELKDPNAPLQGKPKLPESVPEILNTPPAATEAAAPPVEAKVAVIYWIQVGVFTERAFAETQKAQVALQGLQSRVSEHKTDTQSSWRVRIGPYAELQDLNGDKNKLDNANIAYSVIKANK